MEAFLVSTMVVCLAEIGDKTQILSMMLAARFQRVNAAFAKFATATAWFIPELLAIPEATVTGWIAQTPALAPYRFTILDNYRQQAHVLDERGERLLSLAGQFNGTPRSAYAELSTSDIKFPFRGSRDHNFESGEVAVAFDGVRCYHGRIFTQLGYAAAFVSRVGVKGKSF